MMVNGGECAVALIRATTGAARLLPSLEWTVFVA